MSSRPWPDCDDGGGEARAESARGDLRCPPLACWLPSTPIQRTRPFAFALTLRPRLSASQPPSALGPSTHSQSTTSSIHLPPPSAELTRHVLPPVVPRGRHRRRLGVPPVPTRVGPPDSVREAQVPADEPVHAAAELLQSGRSRGESAGSHVPSPFDVSRHEARSWRASRVSFSSPRTVVLVICGDPSALPPAALVTGRARGGGGRSGQLRQRAGVTSSPRASRHELAHVRVRAGSSPLAYDRRRSSPVPIWPFSRPVGSSDVGERPS